jgi:hypothetical protein
MVFDLEMWSCLKSIILPKERKPDKKTEENVSNLDLKGFLE